MENQSIQSEQATPEAVQPVEAPVVPETVPSETPVEAPVETSVETSIPEGLDRSVYNCPDCKGEGLKSQTEVCRRCNGTGKVQA